MGLGHMAKSIETMNREIANHNTFGHLKCEPNKRYEGYIIIAIGEYNNEVVIVKDDFPKLDNSPWQYSDFHEFVNDKAKDLENGVYIYHGWYKKFQNGNFQFGKGEFKNLKMGACFLAAESGIT
jgi:hypothetical protein